MFLQVIAALEALSEKEEDLLAFQAKLEEEGKASLGEGAGFEIIKGMCSWTKGSKKISEIKFTPSVIEPSFGEKNRRPPWCCVCPTAVICCPRRELVLDVVLSTLRTFVVLIAAYFCRRHATAEALFVRTRCTTAWVSSTKSRALSLSHTHMSHRGLEKHLRFQPH